MKLNLKMLAVSAALLGLLAAGAALPASAAGPLNAAAALSLPWSAAAVESVETGTYASTMTVGTQQQLSPVILPAKAARKATVTFISNDSTIVNVTSEGVAQAVGVGTAQVIASADGVSCVYTITTELDESMIVKEMDITLASGTIAVGETTSLSLGVQNVELLDTPGILWPKFEDQMVGLRLAFIGSIKDEILNTEELAAELIQFMKKHYAGVLAEKYAITEVEDPYA